MNIDENGSRVEFSLSISGTSKTPDHVWVCVQDRARQSKKSFRAVSEDGTKYSAFVVPDPDSDVLTIECVIGGRLVVPVTTSLERPTVEVLMAQEESVTTAQEIEHPTAEIEPPLVPIEDASVQESKDVVAPIVEEKVQVEARHVASKETPVPGSPGRGLLATITAKEDVSRRTEIEAKSLIDAMKDVEAPKAKKRGDISEHIKPANSKLTKRTRAPIVKVEKLELIEETSQ